jgi:hypothetical protein
MSKPIIFLAIFSLLCVLSTQYDAAVANEMAKASFATYCTSDRLEGMKCGANCNSLKGYSFTKQTKSALSWVESLTFSSFVNNDKKRVILAFRGTNTATQLAKEIGLSAGVNFALCGNVKNAKALKYFYDGYNNQLRSSLLAQVKDLVKSHPGFSFYITGHSLGGALATIAALDLSCNGIVSKNQLHLYTFGSPRVGDVHFANAVMGAVSEHWRVVHDRDAVPHIPPCKMDRIGHCSSASLGLADNFLGAFNYGWHLGHEVFYNNGFSSHNVCNNSEDPSCSNKYPPTNLSIDDHNVYLGTRQSC